MFLHQCKPSPNRFVLQTFLLITITVFKSRTYHATDGVLGLEDLPLNLGSFVLSAGER